LNEVEKLRTEVRQYHTNDGAFSDPIYEKNPRIYWNLIVGVPTVQKFALKIFSIVPHGAAVERLFSTLSLCKSKIRNRLSVQMLKNMALLRAELKKDMIKPTVVSRLSIFTSQNDPQCNLDEIMNDEDEINEIDREQLEDEIEEWVAGMGEDLRDMENEEDILNEFFDFDLYAEEIGGDAMADESNNMEEEQEKDQDDLECGRFYVVVF